VTKAKYNHLIQQDFNVAFDMDDCTMADSSCTEDEMMKLFNGDCSVSRRLQGDSPPPSGTEEPTTSCNVPECLYQFGECNPCKGEEQDSCEVCAKDEGELVCLRCKSSYFQYFTSCVTQCPIEYTESSEVSRLCVRKA
jgi:hypothetical protein